MPLITLVGEIDGTKGLSVISSTIVAPAALLLPGIVNCQEIIAPVNARIIKVSLDRTLWSDPATKIAVLVEKLGKIWNPFLFFTAEGGVPGESFVSTAVSPGEKFRTTLDVTGSFTSSAKMDFYG